MNIDNFISELSHILETSIEDVSMNDKLNKFETWDSLAMMTFVVIFRDKVEKEIDPMKIVKCIKVSDLFDLIN